MNKKAFLNRMLIYILLFAVTACSKEQDDETLSSSDPFYNGAKLTADISLLFKFWSIYEVNFQSQTAQVPHNYMSCDRDFFRFTEDGDYEEYIISNSGCIPDRQNLEWSYENGVITFSNSFNDSDEMVVLELTEEKFVFRVKIDFDGDGELDLLQFLARPYTPVEQNFYQNSIEWDASITNKIRLTWSEYEGINTFDRYEVFLSTDNCNINNATLIATISEKEVVSFEDENPPQANQLCYFIKIYTDSGILFQSNAASITPEFLDVPGVELKEPVVVGNSIELNWEKYQGLYFSRYELVVKNYFDGFGGGYQEKVVAEVTDIDETVFIDAAPPLVKNPVYEIRVYNTFGRQNFYNSQEVSSVQETNYIPQRVIDILDIYDFAVDENEPIVYLFGSVERTQEKRIIRYNYNTLNAEAVSNRVLNFGTYKEMRLVVSNGNKELLFLGNNELLVFDAQSLEYKYNLENNAIRSIDDFLYLGNNIYALIDDETVFTIERDFSNIALIDSKQHFEPQQNPNNYRHQIFEISNNRVLIGNANETGSLAFGFDLQGNLTDRAIINVPILSTYQEETLYDENENTLVNLRENRIYDLDDNSVDSFEQPYFPKAFISNGLQIIGSNNDPEWQIDDNSLHEKSARIYNFQNRGVNISETEGYPHLFFENSSGEVLSISTYFKRRNASTSYEKPDFFIEKID